jgi:urea transport system ATP-binding protein
MLLALDGVGAAYGLSPVLNQIAMEIAPGEAVALLGRNGVGKTTLLRTITGLHRANAGRISFADTEVAAFPAFRRARLGIGYVPQGRAIFPLLTVEENLALGSSSLGSRGTRSAVAPLAAVYDLFPTLARLRALSGGEQQQLALGRALVGKPRLLLLDEPTEGIQPSIVAEIGRALGVIRTEMNVALLLVEQHLDFAWSIAERYYVMQRGSMVKTGTTKIDEPADVVPLLSV